MAAPAVVLPHTVKEFMKVLVMLIIQEELLKKRD